MQTLGRPGKTSEGSSPEMDDSRTTAVRAGSKGLLDLLVFPRQSRIVATQFSEECDSKSPSDCKVTTLCGTNKAGKQGPVESGESACHLV